MPARCWAGFQRRRPKLRKSMRPPREFGNKIGFSDGGSRSSAARLRLERNRTRTQSCLGVLEAPVRERAPHIDDAGPTIDVASLEPEELRGSKPGRRREDHHRPVHRPKLSHDGLDLLPRLEGPLLLRTPGRVRDALRRLAALRAARRPRKRFARRSRPATRRVHGDDVTRGSRPGVPGDASGRAGDDREVGASR